MLSYAAYAPANLLQKANSGSNWRLSSERVGGTESRASSIPNKDAFMVHGCSYYFPLYWVSTLFTIHLSESAFGIANGPEFEFEFE